MADLRLGTIGLSVDVDATRRLYAQLTAPDPTCCNACATFDLAMERQSVPEVLMTFLQAAGVDPRRPAEAHGVPEAEYLGAWWPIVGPALDEESTGDLELAPGLLVRLTHAYPRPEAVVRLGRVPAVEANWSAPIVAELETEAGR